MKFHFFLFVLFLFFSCYLYEKGVRRNVQRPKAFPFHVERKEVCYSTEQKNIWEISFSFWTKHAYIYIAEVRHPQAASCTISIIFCRVSFG